MPVLTRAAAGAVLLALLAGCAATRMGTPGDPLERMNRATYRFNDAVDRGVLKPVATGYHRHVPRLVQTGIDNFLDNLAFPTTIVNDFLQLKIKDTLIDLGRFAVNTTLGIGGLLDPASAFGIPRNDEDFGQTLGRWGVPAGPYLVLPFLGPSTLRDGPSRLADAQTDLRVALNVDTGTKWALVGMSLVNGRVQLLPYDASLASAYDRYAFVRNAWLQRREYQVKDGDVAEDIPLEDLEDPSGTDATPPGPDDIPAANPAAGGQAGDQAPAAGSSSAVTSLMPASDAMAGGRFR
jgi:phospholipid-binding lipoprotein MlaA